MNESSGAAIDSTGNNNGVYEGNLPNAVAGQIGNTQDLDGTGDYVSSTGVQTVQNVDFSVSTWFKTSASVFARVVGARDSNADFLSFLIQNSGEMRFRCYNGNTTDNDDFTTNSSYNDNSFHLTHAVYDISAAGTSSAMKLYVDGNDDTNTSTISNTGTSDAVAISEDLYLGARNLSGSADSEWDGLLGEIRIIANTLSADWITTEHNNQNDNAAFWVATEVETVTASPIAHILQMI
jgi:hypothetical protein